MNNLNTENEYEIYMMLRERFRQEYFNFCNQWEKEREKRIERWKKLITKE